MVLHFNTAWSYDYSRTNDTCHGVIDWKRKNPHFRSQQILESLVTSMVSSTMVTKITGTQPCLLGILFSFNLLSLNETACMACIADVPDVTIGSRVFEGSGVAFPTFPLTCVVVFKTLQDAQLSQRDRAAGCVVVFAKSRRLELRDNILRTV